MDIDKKTLKALKTVKKFMNDAMYERHTEYTYGNEHDRMRDCCDFIQHLIYKIEEGDGIYG